MKWPESGQRHYWSLPNVTNYNIYIVQSDQALYCRLTNFWSSHINIPKNDNGQRKVDFSIKF